MRIFLVLSVIFCFCLPQLAVANDVDDYDIRLDLDDLRRFVDARIDLDIMARRISIRAAIGIEDPQALADAYNDRLAEILTEANMDLDRFNDLNLVVNGSPEIAAEAVRMLDGMDPQRLQLARTPQDFDELKVLMRGQTPYRITRDMIPVPEDGESDSNRIDLPQLDRQAGSLPF